MLAETSRSLRRGDTVELVVKNDRATLDLILFGLTISSSRSLLRGMDPTRSYKQSGYVWIDGDFLPSGRIRLIAQSVDNISVMKSILSRSQSCQRVGNSVSIDFGQTGQALLTDLGRRAPDFEIGRIVARACVEGPLSTSDLPVKSCPRSDFEMKIDPDVAEQT